MSRKILVVGPSWVGDMVMAQSLFMTLKQQAPNAIIDVLAPSWSLPVIARMPEVNQGIALPIGHGKLRLCERYKIGRRLKQHHYDEAIVLPRSMKSALVPFFANAKQRTGYRGEFRYGLLNNIYSLDKSRLPQTVQKFVALAHPKAETQAPEIPFPQLKVDRAHQKKQCDRLKLQTDRPAVAFMPGAEYGPAKQWPAEYFAQLARKLLASGQSVWILGSQKDAPTGEQIIRHVESPHIHNLCGQTSLTDVIDLLAGCQQAICNDSGLMHIAAAVNTPLVAIYGSSSPQMTPPLTTQASLAYLNLNCSPCFKRICPLGHTDCLKKISPEAVLKLSQSMPVKEN